MATTRYYGTGRRKSSVARVYLVPGTGKVTINKKDMDDYFGYDTLKVIARQPLELTSTTDKFDVLVNVKGGGYTGQAGAIRHGIARALCEADADLRPALKKAGFLIREGGQPLDESPSIYENRYSHSRGQGTASRSGSERRTRTAPAVVPAGRQQSSQPVARPDTMVYYLSSLSECAAVIRDIIAGTSALVNFDDTDDRLSQRILDTLAGAAFALNAKVRKITDNTYLIAPENVNVNMSRHVERRY